MNEPLHTEKLRKLDKELTTVRARVVQLLHENDQCRFWFFFIFIFLCIVFPKKIFFLEKTKWRRCRHGTGTSPSLEHGFKKNKKKSWWWVFFCCFLAQNKVNQYNESQVASAFFQNLADHPFFIIYIFSFFYTRYKRKIKKTFGENEKNKTECVEIRTKKFASDEEAMRRIGETRKMGYLFFVVSLYPFEKKHTNNGNDTQKNYLLLMSKFYYFVFFKKFFFFLLLLILIK